ncbi:MAG: thioredoxin domain-containing protein [Alphaproteobacteria bacterium]|nr:thioredoxin domain-containing protein [Alphaproteobacteria bacterium]
MTGNQLGLETSPYLLQHRDNPVHWRAWGPEALAEAAAENKPILLSVGYAACHWCHVMAHESFENSAIAALMNDLFVNIKVDREERPDIDTIYQSALAMLGQQGGWPLTMFLTPAGEPFWGGTYFPPETRWGRPGFPDVLRQVAKTYRDAPERIDQNVAALRDGLAAQANPKPGDGIGRGTADEVADRILQAMDRQHGGLGDAPKFPQCAVLKQLWSAGGRIGDPRYRKAVHFALRQMCEGGIYDHLGGGFARYTVDRIWLVPHFEKMLYDNAQLLDMLTLAWCDNENPLYRQRAAETVAWLRDDMTVPEGAFAAARDADSEGEEGKYYVWDEAEIDTLLGDAAAEFKSHYDIRPGGNWEGKSILNRLHLDAVPDPETETRLTECRKILLAARDKRVPPLKDDKVLTDWNGLTIAALARAGRVFDQPDWIEMARRAFDFVAGPMAESGRLRHAYREGRARHAATVDDYAAMMRAALTLHEATGENAYLDHAEGWADVLDRHYRDTTGGAYFLTPDDAEALVARTKSGGDNATPSGNGMLVFILAQLAWRTGRTGYLDRAEEIVRTFAGEMERNFFPYSNVIEGARFLEDGIQIVIVGPPQDAATAQLRAAAERAPLAERMIAIYGPEDALPDGHPAAGKGMVDGSAAAYVCRGPVCSLPITDPADLRHALSD